MPITIIITTTLLVLLGVVLVFMVLLQNPKDEGQSPLGGSQIQDVVGVVGAQNFLEKITYSLAFMIFVLVLLTSFLLNQRYGKPKTSAIAERIEQYEVAPEKNSAG